MDSVFELLDMEDSLPFDVRLHSVHYVTKHWHDSVEIIFVLRGTLEVAIGNDIRVLTEGDVLVINPYEVHEVIGLDDNVISTYQIPVGYIKRHIRTAESIRFACDSGRVGQGGREALEKLRRVLGEMIRLAYRRSATYELDMQARMLAVMSILISTFNAPDKTNRTDERHLERVRRIIQYIEDHYKEPITLQSIAEREYLSVPYLSKLFNGKIGMTFRSYLTTVRLKYAVEELLQGEETPIADLSARHGFSNARSFYAVFKHHYHLTPNEYRRQYRPKQVPGKDKPSPKYMEFNPSSILEIVQRYLERRRAPDLGSAPAREAVAHRVPVQVEGIKLHHTWRNLIGIGTAKEGLHADVQGQLRYLQERCPFRYLRFHGIFDDEMMVYQEDDKGRPVFNFRLVDQLFDFLLSIRLKPFVEFGFMPSALAADPKKTVFFRDSCTSPPKSTEVWGQLVEQFVRHSINRYGLEEVQSWRFEFWNEPEMDVFWPGTEKEYNRLYEETYRVIKNISSKLQIGAPGCLIMPGSEGFTDRFFRFCQEQHCLPDFISLHFYPLENAGGLTKSSWDELDSARLMAGWRISPDPDALMHALDWELRHLEETGLAGRDVYLTEWNSTTYHRDLTHDTTYKAAYIVKNIVDNLDRVLGFGYWVLSDNIEETSASPALFHGGLGLLAQHGIPKAAMHAYELLAKLGDRLVYRAEGCVVTAGRNAYQILCFNYCHFDELYLRGELSFMTPTSRYSGFSNEKTVQVEVALEGIPEGSYKMTVHSLGRAHGSSFDTWVNLGAPDSLSPEDIAYLKETSHPRRYVERVTIESGAFVRTCTLEPHAIELVELTPVY